MISSVYEKAVLRYRRDCDMRGEVFRQPSEEHSDVRWYPNALQAPHAMRLTSDVVLLKDGYGHKLAMYKVINGRMYRA